MFIADIHVTLLEMSTKEITDGLEPKRTWEYSGTSLRGNGPINLGSSFWLHWDCRLLNMKCPSQAWYLILVLLWEASFTEAVEPWEGGEGKSQSMGEEHWLLYPTPDSYHMLCFFYLLRCYSLHLLEFPASIPSLPWRTQVHATLGWNKSSSVGSVMCLGHCNVERTHVLPWTMQCGTSHL